MKHRKSERDPPSADNGLHVTLVTLAAWTLLTKAVSTRSSISARDGATALAGAVGTEEAPSAVARAEPPVSARVVTTATAATRSAPTAMRAGWGMRNVMFTSSAAEP